MIYETGPQFFAYVFVEDTFKCIIGKFHHKSITILAGIQSTKFMFKNCQKTNALPILTRISINSVQSFKVTFL